MKAHKYLILIMALLLGVGISNVALAKGKHKQPSNVAVVTGQSDWHVVPPQIPSEYVSSQEDGSVTIEDMPLAGNFGLDAEGTPISGVIYGKLNADLDPTLSGPIYGPLRVTQTRRGKEREIFDGHFFGRVDGLLASGQIVLYGRGEFAGAMLVVSFLETGANTELFDLKGHLLNRF